MQPINLKLVPLALDGVDTGSFERFGQAFYAALVGKSFVPLGGMHDGGAEGFNEPELFDDGGSHFLQISKQDGVRTKIRQTVKRLREFGRSPTSLTYLTSRIVERIDQEEDGLEIELDCRIRIRDAKYIESQINSGPQTISAFESYLRPSVIYLLALGNAPVAKSLVNYGDRTLAVFLRQEVEHRRGKSDLLESVADTLILWALGETDPDKGRFLRARLRMG